MIITKLSSILTLAQKLEWLLQKLKGWFKPINVEVIHVYHYHLIVVEVYSDSPAQSIAVSVPAMNGEEQDPEEPLEVPIG